MYFIASSCSGWSRTRRTEGGEIDSRLVPRRGEVHVVLGVAGPGAAPAPAHGAEGADRPAGDHPAPVSGAIAVAPRRRVAALAAADVGVLDRVDVDGEAVGVHGPRAGAATAGAR